jgi:hypothetical protein
MDAELAWPETLPDVPLWRELLTGRTYERRDAPMQIDTLLAELPAAVLVPAEGPAG